MLIIKDMMIIVFHFIKKKKGVGRWHPACLKLSFCILFSVCIVSLFLSDFQCFPSAVGDAALRNSNSLWMVVKEADWREKEEGMCV